MEHRGHEVVVEAQTDGPALLVLAENRAPGWVASVDGGPWEATLPADVAWQAVPLPGGTHEVRFRYDPASVRWGGWISVASAGVLAFMLLRRRRAA